MDTESNINKITDPTYVGPGTWYSIHLKAKDATTDTKINSFIDFMELLAARFGCKKCRKHIFQYIQDHPFEDLRHLKNKDGVRIGMFKWAWLFHNAVNTRIKKPLVDWETAWYMYDTEIEVCSLNCDNVDEVDEVDGNNNKNNNKNNKKVNRVDSRVNDKNNKNRKSKLAQNYFMKVGIPNTLKNNGILMT